MQLSQVLIASNNGKHPSHINITNKVILTPDQPSTIIHIIRPNLMTSPTNTVLDPTTKVKLLIPNPYLEKLIIRNPSSLSRIVKKGNFNIPNTDRIHNLKRVFVQILKFLYFWLAQIVCHVKDNVFQSRNHLNGVGKRQFKIFIRHEHGHEAICIDPH